MKGRFKSRRAATSVMMIFLLVVLIVFGLLAFMSAYGNYRLGQSGQRWYEQSYEIDSIGERVCAQVDGALREAERGAYRIATGLERAPRELPAPFAAALDAAGADRAALLKRLYLYLAAQGLSQLGIDVGATTPEIWLVYGEGLQAPEDFLELSKPLPARALALDAKLTSFDERRFLLLTLDIQPPAYALSGGSLVKSDEAGQRFRVERWQQQQPALAPGGDDFDGTVE